MRGPRLTRHAVTLVLLAAAALAAPARAQAPAPDTTLGGYLRTLSDSTDRFFGRSAEEADTAGLDTLEGVLLTSRERRISAAGYPTYVFNRVDGSVPGLTLRVARPPFGTLTGKMGWALASRVRLGGGQWEGTVPRGRLSGLFARVWVGRSTVGLNRDYPDGFVSALKGFVYGGDYASYVRRDGLESAAGIEDVNWRAGVGYRDQLESALATHTEWNLLGRDPVVRDNLAATTGRNRELELQGGLRLPRLPVRAEAEWRLSGSALGSDFDYRRVRVAAGGDFPLGHVASLVPQAVYARATGTVPPQAAFYLGGAPTLRSLHNDLLAGTGMAMGRLELIGAQDVLSVLRIRHSEALRFSPDLFVASGAVWGPDPHGGTRPGVDWPERSDWLSEIGAALNYDLGGFGARLSLGWVWPLGPPMGRTSDYVAEVTHPLGLLKPPKQE